MQDGNLYTITYSHTAIKDITKLKSAHLDTKARELINILRENPFKSPPAFEKLSGDLKGAFSRRINSKHRMVYQVFEDERTVKIISLWTHYERL
ncbi:MAG: Txe/YoeB family addiction module toxin [Synergistaceae bacterium]|nr:Txe/YoeB family addiction module toxin [Synergistaceae bacterium]